MRVWQGLENQRMEGEEEKDAGLSGKGNRDAESAPHKPGKARRYVEKDGEINSPLQGVKMAA